MTRLRQMPNAVVSIIYALIVLIITFALYLVAPVTQSLDSRWSVLQAHSFIHRGDLSLDRYDFLDLAGRGKKIATFLIPGINNTQQSYFPLLPALAAVPTVLIAEQFWCRLDSTDCAEVLWRHKSFLEHITAALLTAITAAAMWGCFAVLTTESTALVLTIAFAFGTSCLSIFSRGLWQQTSTCCLQALALACILTYRSQLFSLRLLLCGVCCGLAYFCRPTAILFALALGGFVVWQRLNWRWFLIGVCVGLLPGILLNLQAFGAFFSPYMSVARLSATNTWGEALLGNLISPARGLFFFSPWLLVIFANKRTEFTRASLGKLGIVLAIQCVLHWILVSRYPHWWGGYSFGPRLMSDMLPSLGLLAALSFKGLTDTLTKTTVYVAMIASIAIHMSGAWRVETQYWNTRPTSVDKTPERLWDYSDPPFFR